MTRFAMHDVPPLYPKGVRHLGLVSIALLPEYVTCATSTNSGFGWSPFDVLSEQALCGNAMVAQPGVP